MRNILVTSALPYANGSIHLGHLVEYIQTDIWVRFQRMNGHKCYYVCADDAHGTPIMLKAQELGMTPEQLIEQSHLEHTQDFADFNISFDHYHSTHSEENKRLSSELFLKTQKAGYVFEKTIEQAFDEQHQMFLPDRYVKGTCPHCKSPDQYGDNCEICGATYDTTDLLDALSVVSGTPPTLKTTSHYFFNLPAQSDFLQQWLSSGTIPKSIENKLAEWFKSGLKAWDITRDKPYFGFTIPGHDDKYFYVWLDAPIGYMASFEALCKKNGLVFDEWWSQDSTTELHHFIGKDIVYFHALFWPALLKSCNLRLPTQIHSHGFLTINGQKMSKSRGTFIKARKYLQHLPAEALRYYFAAKLNGSIEDLDLNLVDFQNKINADLVGKVVNIASRCSGFITKRFNGALIQANAALTAQFQAAKPGIISAYENNDYAAATRSIMKLADAANQYINDKQPWVLNKDETATQQLHEVASTGIQLFRLLILYLKPILPSLASDSEAFLNIEPLTFEAAKELLPNGHAINAFTPLMARVDDQSIAALATAEPAAPKKIEATAPTIDIKTFQQLELRTAKILDAQVVEGSDKLLQLTIDVGALGIRQVYSGIKQHYQPEALVGRSVVYIANLQPRKMRFGVSEGMVLAASNPSNNSLHLIEPDHPNAEPGLIIS